MMFYQVSVQNGKHIALTGQEVDYNEKHGWKTVSKEEFNLIPNSPEKIKEFFDGKLNLDELKPKKRGRPRADGE